MFLSQDAATAGAAAGSGTFLVVYIIVLVAFFYFVMARPQKKEQKRMETMLSSLAIGDSIMTTSGFYGVVIDIDEEDQTIVVEFGSNKNCRIIMNKTAVAQVEKANK